MNLHIMSKNDLTMKIALNKKKTLFSPKNIKNINLKTRKKYKKNQYVFNLFFPIDLYIM